MKLIILLICIALQTLLNVSGKRDRYYLFDRYILLIRGLLTKIGLDRGWGAIIGILTPILLVVLILNLAFAHFWPLYLVLGVLVLLFCLDVRDLKGSLSEYFTAIADENMVRAQLEAEKFVNHSVTQQKSDIIRTVTEGIFVNSITNIFGVVFWFLLLGPFGAALYYVAAGIANRALKPDFEFHDSYSPASCLKDFLDWVPVRLVTLTYALIGHFGPVINLWVDRVGAGLNENRLLLLDCGLTALDAPLDPSQADSSENAQALGLVNRTLWTWIIIIAVLNITAWIF